MDHLSIHLSKSLQTTQGRTSLLDFIQTAPLANADWAKIKRLYKMVEQKNDDELLLTLMLRFDQMPFNKRNNNKKPSNQTIAYIKRRVMRFLRNIAQEDAARFLKLAIQFLRTRLPNGTKQDEQLDFRYQWISWMILKGDSKRFEHSRHGRGKVIQQMDLAAVDRTEERFATLWNDQPQMVNELFDDHFIRTTVLDFAVKVLHRNGLSIPTFSLKQIVKALNSNSPWLQVIAFRQAFAKLKVGAQLSNEMAAFLIYMAKGKEQEEILSFYHLNKTSQSKNEKPNESIFEKVKNFLGGSRALSDNKSSFPIGKVLGQLLKICVQRPETSRTETAIALLLEWKDEIPVQDFQDGLSTIVALDHPLLHRLFIHLSRKVGIANWETWLASTAKQDEDFQLAIYTNIGKYSDRGALTKKQLYQLAESNHFVVANFAWYLMMDEYKHLHHEMTTILYSKYPYCGWNYLPVRHLFQSSYGIDLMIEKLPNWHYKLTYHYDFCIKVMEEGHSKVCAIARKVLIDSVNNHFWWGYAFLKDFVDRDEIVNDILPKIAFNRYLFGQILGRLTDKNQWVRDVVIRFLTTQKQDKDLCSLLVEHILIQLHPSGFERTLPLFESPKWEALLLQVLKDFITKGDVHQGQAILNKLDILQPFLNSDMLLDLLTQLDEQEWEQWGAAMQEVMQQIPQNELWSGILRKLNGEGQDLLLSRLMEEGRFKEQILALPNPQVLDVNLPSLADIIVKWTHKHQSLLVEDQQLLFKALIHKLEGVRNIANAICKNVEPSMPFIVQLLESSLPDVEQLGKQMIEESEETAYLEGILSMIDSPSQKVRMWALEMIEKQPKKLNISYVLECLTEHSDPQIQAFVLSQKESTIKDTKGQSYLQKNVLNGRNRARKAKELIKQGDANVPVEILLELARGNNKNDAEWALLELAKASLAGAEIAGFELV